MNFNALKYLDQCILKKGCIILAALQLAIEQE